MESLISLALSAIATSPGGKKAGKELSIAVWTDFLRPIFLKDDPSEAEVIISQIESAPSEPVNQQIIRSKLEEVLSNDQEAIDRLKRILQDSERTSGSDLIVDNTNSTIKNQLNIKENLGPINL